MFGHPFDVSTAWRGHLLIVKPALQVQDVDRHHCTMNIAPHGVITTMQWDGRESVDSYLRVLRRCYGAYCDRFEAVAAAAGRSGKAARFTLDRCSSNQVFTPTLATFTDRFPPGLGNVLPPRQVQPSVNLHTDDGNHR